MNKKKTPTRKLDLFKVVLPNISRKNSKFYGNLSEEEKKEFSPLVVMKFLSGTTNARQVFFLNELVNTFVFTLGKHKELLAHLMTICTTGSCPRYTFPKAKGNKSPTMPNTIKVIMEYFKYSTKDAKSALVIITNAELLSLAEQLGRQPKEISEIKKELKKRC